jgi:hypothetical protein
MKATKEVVAAHEAGHTIITLATPLRDYVVDARVFFCREHEEWRGEIRFDGRDRKTADPHTVYELAKSLAGPLAQLHFFPRSSGDHLAELIKESGGLLEAAKRVLKEDLDIHTNWWPDLVGWTDFCKHGYPNTVDFFAVEEALTSFFQNSKTEETFRALTSLFVRRESLSRDDLLAIDISELPKPKFPDKLRCLYPLAVESFLELAFLLGPVEMAFRFRDEFVVVDLNTSPARTYLDGRPILNAPIGFASGCGVLFIRSSSTYRRNSSPIENPLLHVCDLYDAAFCLRVLWILHHCHVQFLLAFAECEVCCARGFWRSCFGGHTLKFFPPHHIVQSFFTYFPVLFTHAIWMPNTTGGPPVLLARRYLQADGLGAFANDIMPRVKPTAAERIVRIASPIKRRTRYDFAKRSPRRRPFHRAFPLFLLSTLSKALPLLTPLCGHGKSRNLQHGCAARKTHQHSMKGKT